MVLVIPREYVQVVQRGGVTWARKGWWYRRAPPWAGGKLELLSVPQLRQVLRLSRVAHGHYGEMGEVHGKAKGIVNGMPYIATKVAKEAAGTVGGLTRKERAELAHEKAASTIEKLERLIAKKGGAVAPA